MSAPNPAYVRAVDPDADRWPWGRAPIPVRRAQLLLTELAESSSWLSVDQLVEVVPPPRPLSIKQQVRTILRFLELDNVVERAGRGLFRLRGDAPGRSQYYGITVPKPAAGAW